MHQVKSFTQDLGNNPTLENRLYSVKGRARNTKLTLVVYNATSKPLLAEGDFFFFTFDYVKAATLNRNSTTKKDMTAVTAESLRTIEGSTHVSRVRYRLEIEHHITKDLHAFMKLVSNYLQT